MNDIRQALEDMVWQFAYRGIVKCKLVLHTGGLSALESAFDALGWDDPHEVEMEFNACEVEGCNQWAENGVHWGNLYLRLCGKHTIAADRKKQRPAIREYALRREAMRGPDGRLPAQRGGTR